MTGASEWVDRVGQTWAEEWRRTDRSFGALTDRLLETGPYAAALDIGCGAGELVQRLASANADAPVIGVDISPQLLDVARARCAGLPNARFECADAAVWSPAGGFRPDLLISRHGVMFFADPVAAFAQLRGQAAPGARLRFSCFRAREDNRWAMALASVLPAPAEPPDPSAPGPFAFADHRRVRAILEPAGWQDIALEPVDYAMIAGDGVDAIDEAVAYFQRIGPAARAIAEAPEAERSAIRARLRAMLATHHHEGRVALPSAAWIVTARL